MLALGLAGGVLPAGQRERAPSVAAAAADLPVLHPGRPAARVLGPAAAIIGTLLSAGFVVAAELPAPTVVESLRYALFFVAGASWAILMTALVWRRRPGRTPRWPWPIATGDWPILPTRWPACIPACAPRLARAGMERRVPVAAGHPAGRAGGGPQPHRKCKARVPRAAPARSSCITCSTGPRTVSSPWSPPPTCSNRTRRAGWDAMPAPTCATPCTATPAYAMPSLAPPMPPTRARRIACANGWNATAPICANFAAALAHAPELASVIPVLDRLQQSAPVRPAGPVRRRRAAGRRGIQLGRRAGAASLEHAAPEPATGV